MQVADLENELLNYWVAKALSLPVVFDGAVHWDGEVPASFEKMIGRALEPGEAPSLDFVGDKALGHSVIEWIGVTVERPIPNQVTRRWRAVADWRGERVSHRFCGPESCIGETALIAAMRVVVAVTFGKTVPDM
ncbi:hypothetical protein D3C87_616340 [compost metagenome]